MQIEDAKYMVSNLINKYNMSHINIVYTNLYKGFSKTNGIKLVLHLNHIKDYTSPKTRVYKVNHKDKD